MFLRILLFCVGTVFVGQIARAQSPFYQYFQDTLRPGYRASGSFDSIDCKLAFYQTTLPTVWRPSINLFEPERMYEDIIRVKPLRFSAIPHIGLQFSIGSKASQLASIMYTQALTPNQFIQFDYIRTASNGALRSSKLERNHVELAHLYRKQRYVSQFFMLFEGSNRVMSGGLLGDTMGDSGLPLDFQPVEKDAAEAIRRQFTIDWKHFLSFTKDSIVKTGFYLNPVYDIRNRRYLESGDITAIYGSFNYDSIQSRDYWERSSIAGTAGYFLHTNVFSINAGLKTEYWDYDNLDYKSDTVEVSIVSDLSMTLFDRIDLSANGSYNLAGAIGEKLLNATLSYQEKDIEISFKGSFEQKFPKIYQRAYYANVFSYAWDLQELITTTKGRVNFNWKNKLLPVYATAGITNVQRNPFFINSRWHQDTLVNISVLDVGLRTEFKWRKLFFQPAMRFQQSSIGFAPKWQLFGRLGFDGYLFKAKKLRATIGLEAGYCSAYQLLEFVPMMDTYTLPSFAQSQAGLYYQGMPKLHVFTQFELGFFRWFIRAENLEQFFQPTTNQEAIGYPVVPFQIRLGLSWDLFN